MKGNPPFASSLLWMATSGLTQPSGSIRCSTCLFAAGTGRTYKGSAYMTVTYGQPGLLQLRIHTHTHTDPCPRHWETEMTHVPMCFINCFLPLHSWYLMVSFVTYIIHNCDLNTCYLNILFKNQYFCLSKSLTGEEPFEFPPESVAKAETKNLEQ